MNVYYVRSYDLRRIRIMQNLQVQGQFMLPVLHSTLHTVHLLTRLKYNVN